MGIRKTYKIMKAQHTTGPWKASILKNRILFFSIPEDGFCFMTIEDRHYMQSQRNHEWEANAALIAAAPELLEALEHAVSAIQNCDEDTIELASALNVAYNAINKAKGL
jgi:hypothetical protein